MAMFSRNNGSAVAICRIDREVHRTRLQADEAKNAKGEEQDGDQHFDQGDVFDGLSNENTVLNNTIQNNLQYGIYLYERADKNTIQGNSITGNVGSGIYIKTGGNTIKGNAQPL